MLYRFADPEYLLLLVFIPLLAWWFWSGRSKKGSTIRYSKIERLQAVAGSQGKWKRQILPALRLLALTALIVAFARPQTGVTSENLSTEGIDIILALDLSSSMLAEDLQPNRVEAAKQVASEFVTGRRSDRIGLVVFAAEAYTQAPLTLDYDLVANLLGTLEVGLIEDGTAIGMGMATAIKRLRDSRAASKVVIVLTDGRNNRGEIDPLTAAQLAQTLGIRVYTIGAGTRGEAPYPVDDPILGRRYANVRVDIDEGTLRQAAETTGGRYFRATNRESLAEIYAEIDELERSAIEVEHFTQYGELFPYPAALGFLVLLVELGLANTRLRKIP
jgi:Ca-activated chloride channel family protein